MPYMDYAWHTRAFIVGPLIICILDFDPNIVYPNTGITVGQSNFGNRCKVEVISRSDLLRARGFKVDE